MNNEEKTEVKKIVLGILKEEDKKCLRKKEEGAQRKTEVGWRVILTASIACSIAGIVLLIRSFPEGPFAHPPDFLTFLLLIPLATWVIMCLGNWFSTGSWISWLYREESK